jgi:hypothetical protein
VILPLTGVAAATTGVVAWPAAAACATAGGFLALAFWRLRAIGADLAGAAAAQGDVRDA